MIMEFPEPPRHQPEQAEASIERCLPALRAAAGRDPARVARGGRRLSGGELVERLVPRAEGAVRLDEVQPLRPADRTPLVTMQVSNQAVVQGVHDEPDA